MGVAASILEAPDLPASPAARWTRVGRLAAAATLVLGALCQLVAFVADPSHDETLDRLRWVADNPGRADVVKTFDLLAMPFLLGTVLVYVLLTRERSRRLAYAGGILLACGMVGLTAVHGYEILQFQLSQDGRFDLTTLADAIDEISTPTVVLLLLFIPGAVLGLLTMAVALWRSRAVPRGAVLLLPVFVVVDIFLGLSLEAHVISFVAACWFASAVLLAGRAQAEKPS